MKVSSKVSGKVTGQVAKLLGTIAIGGTMALSQPVSAEPHLTVSTSGSDEIQTYDFSRTADQKIKSEDMALVAESLVLGNTTHQAWKLAFRALEQNQFNLRAQLVLKTTAPIMELKGIFRRILPIVRVQPKEYRNYLKHLKDIENDKSSPDINQFLLNGPEDLKSEGQVQDILEKVVERIDELRDWLQENRTSGHIVNMYTQTDSRPCSAREVRTDVWELKNCRRGVNKFTAQMSIADFAAARLAVSGFQTYLAVTAAYSLDGAMANLRLLPRENDTPEQKFKNLAKIPGLGYLRNTKFQVLLPKTTTDFALGLKAAKKMHSTLCPSGSERDQSRKGMLFHRGLCVHADYTDKVFATVELIGRGQLAPLRIQTDTATVPATINSKAFFQTPPKDLRSLAPTFNRCGAIASLGDGRIGGVFVNGELNTVLRLASIENCR